MVLLSRNPGYAPGGDDASVVDTYIWMKSTHSLFGTPAVAARDCALSCT